MLEETRPRFAAIFDCRNMAPVNSARPSKY